DPLFTGDLIERWLRNIHETPLDQLRHLAVEKSKQEGTNVRAVHVGIRHNDNFVIAKLGQVERPLAVTVANPRPDSRDHGTDFSVLQDLVETRFFHIDKLAANRQDSLEFSV